MKPLVITAQHYFRLIFSKVQPRDRSQQRYQRILQASFTAFINKGIGIVVSLISVPLTVNYLGAEGYGIWIAISSLLAWFNLADIGLGNGLTNALANAIGKEQPDAARKHVSNTFYMLLIITFILTIGLMGTMSFVNWSGFFNVQNQVIQAQIGPAIKFSLLFALLGFPLTIIEKILNSHQKGHIANYWNIVGNLASFGSIILVTKLQSGLVWLVIGYSGTLLLVKLLSGIWLFSSYMPWLRPRLSLINYQEMLSLANVGGYFFVVQIAGLLLFQTDYLIIGHYLTVGEVTPYSITWRLFSLAIVLQTITFPYVWPAYTEAFSRNDIGWIKKTFQRTLLVTFSVTVPIIILCVLYGQIIIEKWAGKNAIPPWSLLIWMGIWSIINASMNAVACVLNSVGHLKGQAIYGTITAIVNVILSIWLSQHFGITGIIMGTVLAYALCNVIPAIIETNYVLNQLSKSARIL